MFINLTFCKSPPSDLAKFHFLNIYFLHIIYLKYNISPKRNPLIDYVVAIDCHYNYEYSYVYFELVD